VRKQLLIAGSAALVLTLALVAGASSAPKAGVTAALVSDIGKFNDRGFNQNQLTGLTRSKSLGVTTLSLQSNSVADYIPNLTSAVRKHADIIISAGFLLANDTATVAKKYPGIRFAITDYPVEAAPFADAKTGKVLFNNVEGLTYSAEQAGCLVGVLAAKTAEAKGHKIIGAVAGLSIPPVNVWVAGYKFCAKKAVPGTKVLLGYSQDFVATDKCKTVAENQIAAGAEVLFQVAGGCGLGVLKAADEAGKWGIGVDVDQYALGKNVLTSAIKRVDVGVYQAVKSVSDGTYNGGHDLNFDLKNGGVGVGKISPTVPKAYITLMNSYKAKIIAGTLKIPTSIPKG